MMNKLVYENPEIEILSLEMQDIITNSAGIGENNETELPWQPLFMD